MFTEDMVRGKLIVYSGPSGVGKGTVKKLFFDNKKLNLKYSVSATTRNIRPGEVNGKDYYFLTKDEFTKWIHEGKFLEWAEYAGNYYGTPIEMVNEELSKGYNVLLEIEVEGVKQVIKKMPDAITIFLLPPSIEELRKRLTNRGTESKEVVEQRLQVAEKEMQLKDLFQYKVINQHSDEAAKEIVKILEKKLHV